MQIQYVPGPLDGVLVVSIEQALAAPLCSARLAEMGARVIKIERAEGDFARTYDTAAGGESSYFVWTNRGKESLVLDFKNPADATLLHQILAQADVFIQNLAPGALERAGFGSATLRDQYPQLITCDISGYGNDNPASDLKAYDLLVQCESGLAGITGVPEGCGRIGVSICDIGAGLNACIGIQSALLQRQRTGRGLGISVSLFDGAADWMTIPYLHHMYGDGAPGRQGLRHPSIAPYGAYPTKDGNQIVISIQNEREWQQFCRVFLQQTELAGDPRFCSNNQRVNNRAELDGVITHVFTGLTTSEALQTLRLSNTAFAQVRTVEQMSTHPALRTRPMKVRGRILQMIASPVQTPWDSLAFSEVPELGQHNLPIRAEFSTHSDEVSA